MSRWQFCTLVLTAVLVIPCQAELAPVTPARLAAKLPEKEWLHYGGGYANWRYSPLEQISKENVSRLTPAWIFQSGVQGQVAASPIVADGILYFTAAYNHLYALDAADGHLLWRYEHMLPSDLRLCCGPANRGVAIRDDKVFMATLDARLIAFDRATGEIIWNVVMDDYQRGYSATGAPLVVNDLVVVGSGGGEFATRGFIDAYDAQTGQRRWRRYTVPVVGEAGAETWANESWKLGGAPAWVTGTYDQQQNILFWTTGNPSPLFNGDARQGDNLYSNSVLALDPFNGDLKWHFQYTPHDVWDFDATNNLVLIDTQHHERTVRALVQPNRNGFLYVLDAANGKFLRGAKYVEKMNWATGLDTQGRPQIDPKYIPAQDSRLKTCPGAVGGNNGSFTYAYSPRTHWLYVPTIESCLSMIKEDTPFKAGDVMLGGGFGDTDAEQGVAYGHVSAIDPATGEIKWRFRDKYPLVGGALATGGGVVFTGNQDGEALALDDSSGKLLWKFQTGSAVRSQPVTYQVGTRQYVAIGSGAGGMAVTIIGEPPLRTLGSALVVFTLPTP